MNRLLVSSLLILGSFALFCRCDTREKDLETLQQVLGEALAKIPYKSRSEVEALMSVLDKTRKGDEEPDYKSVFIAYRQSKGPEATATAEKRIQLFDRLEESCKTVRDQLEEFVELDRKFTRKYPNKSEILSEVVKYVETNKWAHAYWACKTFLGRFGSAIANQYSGDIDWNGFTNARGSLVGYCEVRAIGDFNTDKKPSRLRFFRKKN